MRKKMKVPKKYFEDKRLEIGRILVQEFEDLKSPTKISEVEFMRLVDRLHSLLH